MKSKRLRKAEQLSSDRISILPQPILETILCFLPTKQAARTSILSREWRYKWTTIPKLEFSHTDYCVSVSEQTSDIASTRRNINARCVSCYDLHQILLLRQATINELKLILPEDDCLELDQIILHLSRNHAVKKLELFGWDLTSRWYKLPISVFSFHHVTDLELCCVDIDHPPIFNGFGSLRNLCLRSVGISTKTLLHLLSNCPSLKSLSLFTSVMDFDDKCTVIELFKCLPVIEHLNTWLHVYWWLVVDSVQQELPTSLIHLKSFCFEEICCVDGYGLAFLLVLIRCSPNLEKIKLENESDHYKECSIVWEEYSDVWLEHLNEVEIGCFSNTKREMEFVKFILARSPKLKKLSIYSIVRRNQESKMLKALLQAPRVSPVVITVRD
ncbi:hypothetical protein M8C21_005497 [Ambrosia artemisiifolia]|uniref:FBD domain-containing protein n=1 Tax=Ambrosia artemisiifolia TaxID=4212 RepID=A0AAD5G197_AMBAR|nr:hypothetical protein M8C21_005497 [Ambrosia artemisiifolia]